MLSIALPTRNVRPKPVLLHAARPLWPWLIFDVRRKSSTPAQRALLDGSDLPAEALRLAQRIFRRYAEAEARVHRRDIEAVTFHDLAGLDAIVDVVGTAIGLTMLGVERVFASAVPTGLGMTRTEHGAMPIPTPTVLELLRGAPLDDCLAHVPQCFPQELAVCISERWRVCGAFDQALRLCDAIREVRRLKLYIPQARVQPLQRPGVLGRGGLSRWYRLVVAPERDGEPVTEVDARLDSRIEHGHRAIG